MIKLGYGHEGVQPPRYFYIVINYWIIFIIDIFTL